MRYLAFLLRGGVVMVFDTITKDINHYTLSQWKAIRQTLTRDGVIEYFGRG